MRRQDREMNAEFGLEVIDRAPYGVVGMVDEEGLPYMIPLSVARSGMKLYFHSALEGTKNDLFAVEGGNPVMVNCVCDVQVPDLYSNAEIDGFIEEGILGKYASKIFTTEFASVNVRGVVHPVLDDAEKAIGLKVICEKYMPAEKMPYVETSIANSLSRTAVYVMEIEMENITAKRKKYDTNRVEMKFGRME